MFSAFLTGVGGWSEMIYVKFFTMLLATITVGETKIPRNFQVSMHTDLESRYPASWP